MTDAWITMWLRGKAELPARCGACRRASHERRGHCSCCGKKVYIDETSLPEPVCQPCRRQLRETGAPPPGAQQRPCTICRASFYAANGRKTCSDACATKAISEAAQKARGYDPTEITDKSCEFCGEPFRPDRRPRPGKRKARFRFCSRECYYSGQRTGLVDFGAGRQSQSTGTISRETRRKRWNIAGRHLPAHQVVCELRNCSECSRHFLPRAPHQLVCGTTCRTRRTSRTIVERYHSDPAFRDASIAAAQNRRADKLGLDSIKRPVHVIAYLAEADLGICGICDKPVAETSGPLGPSIDHIVPLSKGGLHELANLQLSHLDCNRRKHNRMPV